MFSRSNAFWKPLHQYFVDPTPPGDLPTIIFVDRKRLGSLGERPKLSWRPPGTLPSGQKPPGVSQSTLQNTALSIQRTPGTLHDILPLVKSFLTAFRTLFCRPDNSDTLARSTSIRSVVHNQSLSDCTSSLHVTSYRPLLPALC